MVAPRALRNLPDQAHSRFADPDSACSRHWVPAPQADHPRQCVGASSFNLAEAVDDADSSESKANVPHLFIAILYSAGHIQATVH
jgi:hypothetical protein